jgi:RNA polymerase-binding transcription factor
LGIAVHEEAPPGAPVKPRQHEQVPQGGPARPRQAAIRDRLLAGRQDAMIRLAALTRDFDGIVESSAAAMDDEHDPEGATNAFERAQVIALIARVREHLAELDAALERLRAGSYGACERCGRPIGGDRLAARPAARTCIACAAARPR